MGFKKGRNRDDICSNKLENYRFEIFNMVGREKDVKHILEKRKFRIQLGIICFGIIAFIALLVGIMPD